MSAKSESPSSPVTHAGGIVYRNTESDTKVLLVRARPEPHEWVLPKGHIEPGETAAETAAREVKEEAGVTATVEQYVGNSSFVTVSGEPVSVAFFLMKYGRSEPSKEGREVRWCTFSEAAQMVPFENLHDILTVAQAKL